MSWYEHKTKQEKKLRREKYYLAHANGLSAARSRRLRDMSHNAIFIAVLYRV